MADANPLDVDLNKVDGEINNKNKVEERIKDLSGKVKEQAEGREAEAKARAEAEARASAAEKERDFFASFADTTTKYPNAPGYKDQIKEKVLAGYSVEDATVSVLAKEGKLTTPPAPRENPAGGSAIVNPPSSGGEKSLSEMSREEKRAALIEAEKRGDLGLS